MSATAPHMFAIVRPDGYGKRTFVSVPYVSALLVEQESPQRYFVLLPEPKPEPTPEPAAPKGVKWRKYKNLSPLEE